MRRPSCQASPCPDGRCHRRRGQRSRGAAGIFKAAARRSRRSSTSSSSGRSAARRCSRVSLRARSSRAARSRGWPAAFRKCRGTAPARLSPGGIPCAPPCAARPLPQTPSTGRPFPSRVIRQRRRVLRLVQPGAEPVEQSLFEVIVHLTPDSLPAVASSPPARCLRQQGRHRPFRRPAPSSAARRSGRLRPAAPGRPHWCATTWSPTACAHR